MEASSSFGVGCLKGTVVHVTKRKTPCRARLGTLTIFVVVNNLDQFSHVSQRSTLTRFQTAKAAQVK